MKTELKNQQESKEFKGLEERIQRLRYDLVFDYKRQKSREALLMFVMDV